MDFGSLSSSLETVPVTRSLEVSDVGSIVEAPSLPPESNCESHRLAFIVGTLFLAVLLTGAASHYINWISRTADPFLDGKQQPILLSSLLRSLVMSEF